MDGFNGGNAGEGNQGQEAGKGGMRHGPTSKEKETETPSGHLKDPLLGQTEEHLTIRSPHRNCGRNTMNTTYSTHLTVGMSTAPRTGVQEAVNSGDTKASPANQRGTSETTSPRWTPSEYEGRTPSPDASAEETELDIPEERDTANTVWNGKEGKTRLWRKTSQIPMRNPAGKPRNQPRNSTNLRTTNGTPEWTRNRTTNSDKKTGTSNSDKGSKRPSGFDHHPSEERHHSKSERIAHQQRWSDGTHQGQRGERLKRPQAYLWSKVQREKLTNELTQVHTVKEIRSQVGILPKSLTRGREASNKEKIMVAALRQKNGSERFGRIMEQY